MADPLAADGQAWPRTKDPIVFPCSPPWTITQHSVGCRPWGLEDGQHPRCGGIYSPNQALLRSYDSLLGSLPYLVLAMYIAILLFYSLRQLS